MIPVHVYKETTDDWRGSYETEFGTKLVIVTFTETGPLPPIQGSWRVCVWGNDNLGMEFDFQDVSTAWNIFLQVIGMDKVNIGPLKAMGFRSA